METFIYVNKKNNINDTLFEVVETKGKGHPDNICDTVAEKTSAINFYNKQGYHPRMLVDIKKL